MNPILQKCPNCNKHTNFVLDNDNVHINCQCGYFSTMNLKHFISQLNHNKTTIVTDDKSFNDIITDNNKGYEHLSTYFKSLKNEHISQLINCINKIESSYEESYNRNKNMLSFIQSLLDNYDGSIEMKRTILKNQINIYKCKENANNDDIIKYFNDYNIIIKKITIEEVKCVKTITDHTSSVFSLLLLKDKRIASCSEDKTIRIYEPSNDYHCVQVIERHTKGITSICEVDDGTIVSCSWDHSIMLGDYTINNAHDDWIYKVITLPNNRIASSSEDKTIKIWKSNIPYSDTPIKVLEGHDTGVISIVYIKEKDIVISASSNGKLCLWNMSTYKSVKVIEGVECSSTNALYQIDKDRVIVGGMSSFCIVNIDKYAIEKIIKDEQMIYVHCFLQLRDKTSILGECCYYGLFCLYDMKTKQYKIKNHKNTVNDFLLIDDNTFLSCSWDKTIDVWKY